jgi:hypothetical protein
MRKHHFTVAGQFDRAGARRPAAVTIDTERQTFTVRPHWSPDEYTLLLSDVAEIVVQRILKANAQKGRAA